MAVGQKVDITLDAFPRSEHWTGTVSKIFPAEKVVEGVIFYETKVVFDNEDPRLKSGMTANLAIEVDRAENVLVVPLRALIQREGEDYIRILENEEPVERPVSIGAENSTHAELISGAEEGELVIVADNTK